MERSVFPIVTNRHNINMVANELQYNIFNRLSLQDLINSYPFLLDEDARGYVKQLILKIRRWISSDLSELLDQNNFEALEVWLEHHPDVNIYSQLQQENYNIDDLYASGNYEALEWLSLHGVPIDSLYFKDNIEYDTELMKWYFTYAIQPKNDPEYDVEILNDGILAQDIEFISWMLDQGVRPDEVNFMFAEESGNPEVFYLINKAYV